MAEEIAVKNGWISNFERLVTLKLTSDLVILHTVVHHSSIYMYMPKFIEIKETEWIDGRTHARTYVQMDGHLRPAVLGRLCRRVNLKIRPDQIYILCPNLGIKVVSCKLPL